MVTSSHGFAFLLCLALVAPCLTYELNDPATLQTKPDICIWYEFRCNDGECIPKGLVCDGEPHCRDKSDEDEKMCQPDILPPAVKTLAAGTVRGLRSATKDHRRKFIRKRDVFTPPDDALSYQGMNAEVLLAITNNTENTEKNDTSIEEEIGIASFSMGCFWNADCVFGYTPGVLTTRVGYTGGMSKEPPTYEKPGDYSEAIEVKYNPKNVTYLQLVKIFYYNHDPTSEFIKQYSSYIYYHNERQKEIAERFLNTKRSHGFDVKTKILPASEFFNAEHAHQKHYLQKHHSLCHRLGLTTTDVLLNSIVAAKLNAFVVGLGGQHKFNLQVPNLGLDKVTAKYVRRCVIENKELTFKLTKC